MAASRILLDALQRYYGIMEDKEENSNPPLAGSQPQAAAAVEEKRTPSQAPAAGPTLSEAIQNLPPELREIILKEYLAIKMRERASMGWDKVHKQISKLTFCQNRQQVRTVIICVETARCPFQGCCYPYFYWEGRD